MSEEDPFEGLPDKCRRGSRARCILMTHGPRPTVAATLSGLLQGNGHITEHDHWMPGGSAAPDEADLCTASRLLDPEKREQLCRWWLAVRTGTQRTPNWDIASTCTIDGRPGLLLVEAKAHDEELKTEEAGKRLDATASADSRKNHDQIGACISTASRALREATGFDWNLSRDRGYQMSNRFAWAWKIASMGVPVSLVYLGFVGAEEMRDRGLPLSDAADWERLVKSHAPPLVPPEAWNRRLQVGDVPLFTSIQVKHVSIQGPFSV